MIVFVLTLALVSTLSTVVGCGGKKTDKSGTATTAGTATTSAETKTK